MIFNRPINLWLGFVTALLAFAQVLIVTLLPDIDPTAVATVLGALGGLLAVIIALVANQAPTVIAGSDVHVVTQTPPGEPNTTETVTV